MAQKKNWYYVLVLTNHGPVFVTDIPDYHTAEWDCLKKPKSFDRYYAEDIAMGLCCNGSIAYAVHTKFELDTQPYLYSKGEFKWEWNEETNKKEAV